MVSRRGTLIFSAMKKNDLFFGALGLLLSAGAFVSCNLKEDLSPDYSSDNVIRVSVEAAAPVASLEGKTTFDGETLVWTGNETMDVLIGNTSSTSAGNAKSAKLTMDPVTNTFSGTIDLGSFKEEDIRAVAVPGNSGGWIRYKSSTFRARIPIPQNQVQQREGVMNGDNFPLYAAITAEDRSACKKADGSYEFKGIQLKWGCAVLRFNVYGSHPGLEADEKLVSITAKFSDNCLQNFEVRLDNDEIIKNSTTDNITVSLAEGAALYGRDKETGAKVYMAMFPYKNKINEIVLKTDKATYTMSNDGAAIKEITDSGLRGKVYQLGLNLSKFVRMEEAKLAHYKQQTLEIIKAAGLPSMQVMYTKGDNISYSYAVTNDEFYAAPGCQQENAPISTESIYHACSIGKVPMGYMAAKLMEEGKLDIERKVVSYYDDPADNEVVDFFKDDGESRENIQDVTVKEILLHTSGVSNSFYWNGDTKNVVYKDSEVASYRGKYRYSTNAIHVLDLLFGHIIGAPLHDYENTYIFDKCGMKTSSYKWTDDFNTLALYGHHIEYGECTVYLKNGWTFGDAGKSLFTNAEEYTRFLRWILDGADFVGGKDSEYYKAMFAKYGVAGRDEADGSLWQGFIWVCRNIEGFGDVYMHSGSLGGFRGQMFIVPSTDETFCCFTNGSTGLNYAGAVGQLFFGERIYNLLTGTAITDSSTSAGKFIIKEE